MEKQNLSIGDKLSILLYYFNWIIMMPAFFVCFVISLFKPDLRESLSAMLETGFWFSALVFGLYGLILWGRRRIKRW